ncbi:MAG: FAD-dependent monooxygenase [Acidimicrobiales bacterium]
MASADVLVVGAGPSGLALALQAATLGASVRSVERRPDPFRPSRALLVHPRTLEVLRPLGVSAALVASGDAAPAVRLHLGRQVVSARLGPFALPDSAFPFLLFERQAVVEQVLADALAGLGVDIERHVELVDLRSGSDGAVATLRRSDGSTEDATARFVAGCDGSASTVRRHIGAGWRGGRHRHEVVLADVELESDLSPRVGQLAVGPTGLLFLLAPSEQATWRLLATTPCEPTATTDQPPADPAGPDEDIRRLIGAAPFDAEVTSIAWSQRVPLEHRLASRYRAGPVFIVGDAAHTHSPAGGQGMNTGIQDGIDLGWKLAFAARLPASTERTQRLLDSYEAERRPVARRVVAATRVLFWIEAGTDPIARLARSGIAPLVAPLVPVLLRRHRLVAVGARSLGQLRVRYRRSPLSLDDGASGPRPHRWRGSRPGDRLPDRPLTGVGPDRLHTLIATPGVHVLVGRDAAPLDPATLGPWARVHRLVDRPGTGVVIVRPDGYVGYRHDDVDTDRIADWLASIGAVPGRAPTPCEGHPAPVRRRGWRGRSWPDGGRRPRR